MAFSSISEFFELIAQPMWQACDKRYTADCVNIAQAAGELLRKPSDTV
jgi:hypothetical protein